MGQWEGQGSETEREKVCKKKKDNHISLICSCT